MKPKEKPPKNTVMKKLQGKVAIITGGASGIGEATARLFADQGARAIVIVDVQDELAHKLVQSIGPNRCIYTHCDVTDEEQVKSMVKSTVKKYGQLDIMFSNAGIISKSDQIIDSIDFSEFDRVFAVNVRGMAACMKHAAHAMVGNGTKGSIVCTASVAGSKGIAISTDYCMSKHAVIGLARCASKQLGKYGIRVNSVSPSTLATPLSCGLLNMGVGQVEEFSKREGSLKGVVLKVSNVADAVLFLVSDDSEFITGHDLHVDGGFCV